jgi:endonuclease/exonuclease/phosphatase family metal-dependent hydrolase
MRSTSHTSDPYAIRPARRRSRYGVFARLFIAGFAGVLLLFLTGYASAYLPPESFWWAGLLASILTYLAALALLLSLAAWITWRGFWFIPLLLLLLLTGMRYLTPGRLWLADETSPDDLVLMTYNAPVRGPNPDTLSLVTVDLIREIQPDILALQEPMIWLQDGRRGQQKATAHLQAVIDSLEYWAPTPGRGNGATLSQPVIARFPLGAPSQHALPMDDPHTGGSYLTRVPFTWEGRPAVLYNVHLYTTGEVKPWQEEVIRLDPRIWLNYLRQYRAAYLRRAEEARQLRSLIEHETLPLIVMGDFNSTMHHWELRHIGEGLRDAFQEKGQGWGATYHMRHPFFRIDHILVSPEWRIISAHVPSTETLSDHRPVVARLLWRDAE